MKSTHVLPLFDAEPHIRRQVLENVEAYSIFIVDFHEYRRQVLDPLIKCFAPLIPPGQDQYEFVLELPDVGSRAQMFLRQMLLNESVLGRLESVLEWAADPWGVSLDTEFPKLFGRPAVADLTSAPTLQTLSQREFAVLLARLGAAIGDMLVAGTLI